MRKHPVVWIAVTCAFGLSLFLSPGAAGQLPGFAVAHAKKGKQVKQGAKAFGRGVKSFFKGGKKAAKASWKNKNAK